MNRRRHAVAIASLWWLLGPAGCGPSDESRVVSTPAPPREGPVVHATLPQVVALGDSLTAGLGIGMDEAYPARLQQRMRAEGYNVEVVNAGQSGDTSAGGLRRLDWVLGTEARVLIVALGGNDGLRGLPPDQMKSNLNDIIGRATAQGLSVLLAGMEAPPNYGPAYTASFRRVFRELADAHDVVFVPFLLEGVAGEADLNQPDGIHPNVEGARLIAAHLWPALEPLVKSVVEK